MQPPLFAYSVYNVSGCVGTPAAAIVNMTPDRSCFGNGIIYLTLGAGVPSTTTTRVLNVGLIAGLAIGGFFVVVGIVVGVLYYKKMGCFKPKFSPEPTIYNPAVGVK